MTLDQMQSGLYNKYKVNFAKIYDKKVVFLNTIIRELRKARKISQEELAQAVGVTRQTITSIETGKYTASLLLAYKIAKYFGMCIEDVFDFSEVEEIDGTV